MVASIKRRSGGVARGLISPPRPIRRQSLPAKSSSILNLGEPSSSEEEKMQIWQKWQHLNLSLWCDEKYQCHIRLFIWLSISIYTKVELKYTWCMWTQGLEYTWCMWTQWLEYTLPMLFLIFVRLLRQCTPSCSLLKYTYTKLSQLQPWAPAAATSADSNKCLHSRST